ncbi:MAG: hypothetical protein L6R42_001232 [Xanthoria sp. 1 TBL-2021]|nr:MAG: hypothetical protein L6R42_001232 [Xanthoria sp. 1 TBL-2021]
MKAEHDYDPHHADDYGATWVHVTDDQPPHQSPLHDFNHFYMSSPSQLHLESIYSRPAATSQTSNPPLYPLIVPQWPSQLTNPSLSPPSSQPLSSSSAPAQIPRPILPLSTPVDTIPTPLSAPAAPTPIPIPQSGRRTLTDQDRRRMCQYHEENPSVKQTEIGTLFGVERSTVSKVLRLKEKYLHPDDGSRSPIKRSKGKFPDIERAVSNWAKNHQRQGLPLSNESIRDKARMFATTVGSSDCVTKVNNPNWLEKFKHKNGLLGASLPDSSENEDSDMIQPSDPASGEQTPIAMSPISPAGDRSGSVENDVLKDASGNSYREFGFRRTHSESNNSLGSYFTDNNIPSTFSPDIRSPTSPFFSPVSSCGPSPSIPSQTPRLAKLAPADARPRRQTFPTISSAPSYITPPTSATVEPIPTTQLFQQSMTTSALSSPLEELEDPMLSIDSAMHHHQNSISHSTMAPPPNPSSVSPPNSPPSQDEARRALEVVMTFFQSSMPVDPQDYFTMGKLMEKLKLRRDDLPAGLRSLMDKGRKRSIHSLS